MFLAIFLYNLTYKLDIKNVNENIYQQIGKL